MGLFDTIKGEAKRNFIARADEAKNEIIYKYPEQNIRMMTQLTVDADEVALFVKDGQVEGKLGPGRHTLDTNNIPFLSRLLEKFTGGNLFVAEVYFVSTREFPGVKFGGPIGDVRDPETGLGIGTMVYGDFSHPRDRAREARGRAWSACAAPATRTSSAGSRARCSRSRATASPSSW